ARTRPANRTAPTGINELLGGLPVAMAPPAKTHRILNVRLVSQIDAALSRRRPSNAQIEASVIGRSHRSETRSGCPTFTTASSSKKTARADRRSEWRPLVGEPRFALERGGDAQQPRLGEGRAGQLHADRHRVAVE